MSNYLTLTVSIDQAAALIAYHNFDDPEDWGPDELLIKGIVEQAKQCLKDRLERNQETERRLALHAAHEASGTDAEESVGDGGQGSRFLNTNQ